MEPRPTDIVCVTVVCAMFGVGVTYVVMFAMTVGGVVILSFLFPTTGLGWSYTDESEIPARMPPHTHGYPPSPPNYA